MSKAAAERLTKKTNNLSVAEFLTLKIDASAKSQAEIAQELGYPNANIITMFKQGRTKLPIPKVPALAKALEIDPVNLMRVVLTEYAPDTWAVLEQLLDKHLVTEAEMSILAIVRETAGGLDAAPRTEADKEELKSLTTKWINNVPKVVRHH